MFRKIALGISGGVDSAVSALLLKNAGFTVQGVFMKNWDLIDEHAAGDCSMETDWSDAQWICDKLKIPIIQVNFVKQYWNEIFGQFIRDYENGLTPNPDILCNKHIKFDAFFNYAIKELNADAIATGHYARSSFGQFLEFYQNDKNAKLLCAIDTFKDQTFFLSQIPQMALRKTMFPLGYLSKNQVKQIAMESGLDRIAMKRESTGICFVGKRNFQEFIQDYVVTKPGDFRDWQTGQIVGQHNGIHNWTIGQRCRIISTDKPYYILRKNTKTNTIDVVKGTDHPALFTNILYTEEPQWIDGGSNRGCCSSSSFAATTTTTTTTDCDDQIIIPGKFRFQHTKPLVNCVYSIIPKTKQLFVKLKYPLRALTPGQYAVFYTKSGGECLGSARIISPGPSMAYGTNDDLDKFHFLLNQLKSNNNIFIES